jgi:GAF domain-containing protein
VTEPGFERAAAALARAATVRELLHTTCEELVDLLGGAACAISRVVGDLLVGLEEYTHGKRPLELGHEYLISDFPLTEEVVTRGESRRVSLLDDTPDPDEAALLEQLGFESLLMVPLPSGGECWALVEVYANGKRFEDDAAGLAMQIAARAGELLERFETGRAR